MVLRGVDGGPDRASIAVPEQDPVLETASDGAGYLVVQATGGFYDATPSGLRRITSGSLLAAGPTGWLALECDDRHRCRSVAIDRATGSRRTVRAALSADGPRGVIAPDGRTAAMFSVRDSGTVGLYLLDLASGARRPIDLPIYQAVGGSTVVWSPDSRWLFLTGPDGSVWAVDPATTKAVGLGVSLAPPGQLAVRPGT